MIVGEYGNHFVGGVKSVKELAHARIYARIQLFERTLFNPVQHGLPNHLYGPAAPLCRKLILAAHEIRGWLIAQSFPASAECLKDRGHAQCPGPHGFARSEEHTSELQSLMRISYAVFCLKKKNKSTKIRYDEKKCHTKYRTHTNIGH